MAKKKRLRCWVKFAIVIILLLLAYSLIVNFTGYRVSIIKLEFTPYFEIVNDEGLVGYWNFDKIQNNRVFDLTFGANHGELINGVIIDNGHAIFDGADDKIIIPHSNNYSVANTGELSVSFWIKPYSFSFNSSEHNYVNFLGIGGENEHEWTFRVYDDLHSRARSYSFYVFNLTGGLGVGSRTAGSEEVDVWVNIIGITDSNYTYIYRNGVLIDKDVYSQYGINPQIGDGFLTFGSRGDEDGFFIGELDEIRIYNKVLNQSEIDSLYLEQRLKFIE